MKTIQYVEKNRVVTIERPQVHVVPVPKDRLPQEHDKWETFKRGHSRQ